MAYSEKIIQSFSIETRELLSTLDFNLIQLEQKPDNREIIDEIFRMAHSIKSAAALMELTLLSDTAHKIEDLFNLIREGHIAVDQTLITFLLRSTELLSYILDRAIKNDQSEDDRITEFRSRLNDLLVGHVDIRSDRDQTQETQPAIRMSLSETDREIIRIEISHGNSVFHCSIRLFPEVALKYARVFLICNSLQDHCRIIRSQPDIEQPGNDQTYEDFQLLLSTKSSSAELRGAIEDSEVYEIVITAIQPEDDKEQPTSDGHPLKLESGIKIGVTEVDRIVNYMSDLILTRNELNALKLVIKEKMADSIIYDRLNESLFKLETITGNLQNEFMQVRMVPIELLFKPFFKYVRDTAATLNKDALLVTYGQETLIDRTMLDQLVNPLTHLIRNALSHGIEFRTERLEKWKKEKAQIILNAFQTGHSIVLEIEDDGRGLDPDKIMAKALEKRLIPEGTKATDSLLLQLICTPGFSTTVSVSDLSGRGVGMDIVKSMMEKLQGVLELSTQKDIGTKFRLIIPMSLSITRAILVKAATDMIAVPINFVTETILVRRHEITESHSGLSFKDMPLILLSEKWTGQPRSEIPDFLKVLCVAYQQTTIGLAVEEIADEQELVIKDVDEVFRQNPCISAGSVLGDGRIVFILNILNLIKETK